MAHGYGFAREKIPVGAHGIFLDKVGQWPACQWADYREKPMAPAIESERIKVGKEMRNRETPGQLWAGGLENDL
jgi:hypothetical protein